MNSLIKNFEKFKDQDIVNRVLTGETGLYDLLIRKYNSCLYKIGMSYNFNHPDTQDLMQDTFISVYYNLAKFEIRSSFRTWIIKIMLNKCFHKRKKMSFRNEIPSGDVMFEKINPLFHKEHSHDFYLRNRELTSIVENALAKIPEEYRIVFALRELNSLSVTETSEAMNISESNVKIRLLRAKSMLRKEIERIYSPEDIFDFNLIYCDAIVESVFNKILHPYLTPVS